MIRTTTTLVLVLALFLAAPAAAQPDAVKATDDKAAATHYASGKALYARGDFEGAIKAFTAVQRIKPHAGALFSIARCQENLGRPGEALAAYRQALVAEQEPARRRNIERRINAIKTRPVKVFISSRPSGASVSVDGRAEPAAGTTPLVVRLIPGEHVLLVRLKGHHLAAQRVEAQVGKELTTEVTLQALPKPPAPPTPCPAPPPPPKRLIEQEQLQLHISALGSTFITSSRPFAAGIGAQIHGSYRRWVFGVFVEYLLAATKTLTPDPSDTKAWDRNAPGGMLALFEGGYLYSLSSAYLYAVGGAGFFFERQKFAGWERRPSEPTDKRIDHVASDVGFAWSVGGGVGAQVTSWFSVGATIRFGMVHGERTDKNDPDELEDASTAPFTTFAVMLTLHP